ncbi:hypothetical protein INR49_015592 [Caranx melampygus]|nr:hypothetical protein INR49_015592 [Caranx melampygus]
MCTAKCARCIAGALYPLLFLSIICNIILFFPGWDVKYAREGHITEEVKFMGGIIGGGFLILIPALYIHLTGEQGCCGNRIGMLLSIVFAAVGVVGALYSFFVAILALSNGPLSLAYITNRTYWRECTEPKNVVPFNISLFFTLIVVSFLQMLLCASQMINGLFGCLCGTGN